MTKTGKRVIYEFYLPYMVIESEANSWWFYEV
jgi:hypothetical protein